jgi:hypothetical protein
LGTPAFKGALIALLLMLLLAFLVVNKKVRPE